MEWLSRASGGFSGIYSDILQDTLCNIRTLTPSDYMS